jgi:hypothetical protein
LVRGSFARSWRDILVPLYSMFARRFCAIGAVIRAGRELFLPTGNACMALQSQAGRPVESWNDDASARMPRSWPGSML